MEPTGSLHCSSFWGLPFRIPGIDLVKPKKGITMETIGMNTYTQITVLFGGPKMLFKRDPNVNKNLAQVRSIATSWLEDFSERLPAC